MRLQEFQILQKLGVGSFGVVFKAIKKDNGLICVLKEVGFDQMDKLSREWAMNQVAIMKDIDSKYIVQYHFSFVENGKLYICMEYCSGGDLAQYLKVQKGKPLNQDIIWKFSLQIMLGMRTLHLKKILHRDIKTMNIFLTENRQVKIGDLGVAKTMTGDFAKTVVGTPYYLSPEMCEEKPYNEKTDVWAMGCLVYQLCTGKHPFQASNQAALAMKIVMGKYPPLPVHYSPILSWLVKLCLSIDHKRRPTVQYLLSHPDILKKAKSVGITLEEVKQEQNKSKSLSKKYDNANISVAQQYVKITAQSKQLSSKRSDSKKQQKNTIARKEELKQVEQRVKSKSKAKDMKKQAKQVKVNVAQQIKKNIPPKAHRVISQPNRRPQIMEKNNKKETVISATNPIMQRKVIPKMQIQEPTFTQKQQTKIKTSFELYEKERPICLQQNVDDDELFRDFGITPEKIMSLNDKVEFKKTIPINWDGCIPTQQLGIVQKLAVVHNTECKKQIQEETGAMKMKQLDDDQQLMPDQINDDDNQPYRSSSEESFQEETSRESLLIDDLPSEIEEQGELIRTQKISMLQRKIIENERRKKELLGLRTQKEAQLLKKIDRLQLQKIKSIISEGTEEQIEKIACKQLLQYYKIFHYSIEMGRCDETIAKCKDLITQMISLH